uniref:Uncharacterized protein n=1 Tax=Romanomermis culicivorax TaxID=13658 RepID=A0A915I5W4_ROMCU
MVRSIVKANAIMYKGELLEGIEEDTLFSPNCAKIEVKTQSLTTKTANDHEDNLKIINFYICSRDRGHVTFVDEGLKMRFGVDVDPTVFFRQTFFHKC